MKNNKRLYKATLDDIGEARTILMLARERLNLTEDYNLAGELSAVCIVLDELDHYIFCQKVNSEEDK